MPQKTTLIKERFKMRKMDYELAEMEIVCLESADIITRSGDELPPVPDPDV